MKVDKLLQDLKDAQAILKSIVLDYKNLQEECNKKDEEIKRLRGLLHASK